MREVAKTRIRFLIDRAAVIVKLLADLDKVSDSLRVFKGADHIAFQGTRDSMTEGGKLGRFIPRNFGGIPGELGIIGGEIRVPLLDGVEFSFGILDAVGVAESVFKDLYQGGEAREVDGVIFYVRGNLVKGFILEAFNREA